MSDAERARVWRLLFITMTHLLNAVESDLKTSDDLTLIDIGCLFALNTAGESGASMGSLAALYAVDPSVITYRIQRLERRQAVVRRVNPGNRRYTQAHLTEDGRALLRRARAHLLTSADRHFFDHLGDAPARSITDVLGPLLAAQQAGRSGPPDPTR